ncbi:MAG: hypothetical protein WBL63_10965 [Candidatus Acidiferrum sp.]
MAVDRLRVVLAEDTLSETGMILRSLCAEAGWTLELIFVAKRTDLAHALAVYGPEMALVSLSLLQPDAPENLRLLHLANPAIPIILCSSEQALQSLNSSTDVFRFPEHYVSSGSMADSSTLIANWGRAASFAFTFQR